MHPAEPGTRYRLEDLIASSLYPAARDANLLAIRGGNDEASLAIASAAIGERLSRLFANTTSGLARAVGLHGRFIPLELIVIMLGSAYVAVRGFSTPYRPFTIALGIAWSIFAITAVTAYILEWFSAILAGLFRMVFGRELFNTSLLLEVSAESSPDTFQHARVVTFPDPEGKEALYSWRSEGPLEPPRQRGLRHGLYQRPEVIDEIVRWIAEVTHPESGSTQAGTVES
jgi:hypothetical protein